MNQKFVIAALIGAMSMAQVFAARVSQYEEADLVELEDNDMMEDPAEQEDQDELVQLEMALEKDAKKA